MNAKSKTLKVEISASTFRWLRALARGNSKTEMNPGVVTVEDLLAQAAFCMADAAGRRTGSWEADVAQRMLESSGYQAGPDWEEADRCRKLDNAENEAHRDYMDSLSGEERADQLGYTGDERTKLIEQWARWKTERILRLKAAYHVGTVELDETDAGAAAYVCKLTTPDGEQTIDLLTTDATRPDFAAWLIGETAKVEDLLADFDFVAVAAAMRAVKWRWHGDRRSPSISDLRRSARRLLLDAIGIEGGLTSGGFSAERTESGFSLAFELRKS